MELTEKSDYATFKKALSSARGYGEKALMSPHVKKKLDKGAGVVFRRVNTPEKIPTVYIYLKTAAHHISWFTFIKVSGSEGDSFVCSLNGFDDVSVLRSHAINRYIERHGFDGTLEECQNHILRNLILTYRDVHEITKEQCVYFDGGMFLGFVKDDIYYINTYILNRQMYENQRMQSYSQQKELEHTKAYADYYYNEKVKFILDKLADDDKKAVGNDVLKKIF